MIINFKFTDTDPDERIKEYATTKAESFAKFMSDEVYEAAVCDIEFRKSTHHQSGDVCYAEVTLEANGELYRASKEEPTLEKAIDKVKDDILEEMRSAKTKKRTMLLRGAQKVKDAIRNLK